MNKNKLMTKFFITYIFIVLPLLLFTILITHQSATRIREEVNTSVKSQLDRIGGLLEEEYKNYYKNSIRLYSRPEMERDKMLSNPMNARRGLDILEIINLNDAHISNVFVEYNTDEIYSATGFSRKDVHFANVLGCSEENCQKIYEVLDGKNNGVCLLESRNSGQMIYHYKIMDWDGQDLGSINYSIPYEEVAVMLNQLSDSLPIFVKISVDENESVFFSHNVEKGFELIDELTYEKISQDKDYTLASQSMTSMGMYIDVMYRSEQLYETVIYSQRFNYIIIAFSVLITMLVSYYISKKRYKDIKKLELDLKERKISNNNYEFSFVESIVNTIIFERDNWQELAMDSQQKLKQHVATQLFYGLVKDPKDIRKMLDSAQIEIYEEYYFVVGIILEDSEVSIKEFETLFDTDIYCRTPVNGKVAMMCMFESPNEDYLFQKRQNVVNKLIDVGHISSADDLWISYSQMYKNISMISYAYMEAVSTLWKISSKNSDVRVEYWEHVIKAKNEVIQFSEKDIEGYLKALKDEDREGIEHWIKRMNQFIFYQTDSEENRCYLRFCILQPLIQMIHGQCNTKVKSNLVSEAIKLASSDGQGFKDIINKIVIQYCEKQNKHDQFAHILEYVEDNFSRYDLSLDEVADYSGFTKAYLSRLFKHKTGKGYSKYVTELRMKKAKKLLVETDLTIKDIVAELGYIDVPNFRKRFKKECGVNASVYRKQNGGC